MSEPGTRSGAAVDRRPGRAGLVRVLVAVVVMAAAAFVALTSPVKLGLDLVGSPGTELEFAL